MSRFPAPGYRLMIVDDDEMAREVLALLAERAGFAVEGCASGLEALESLAAKAGEELPQGVLADMQMPGPSGETFALMARAACGEGTVVLAMSATVSAEQLRGYDGFLEKPFSMEQMCAALQGAGAGEKSGAAEEVLRSATFAQLSQAMGAEQLRELYRVYLADAEARVATLRRAAAARDGEGWRVAAHQLKGSSAMVGAAELAALASGMEARGVPGVGEAAPFEETAAAVLRLKRILEIQLP